MIERLSLLPTRDEQAAAPLAYKLRPQSLDDYVGQSHLCGESGPIRRLIEQQEAVSLIFWGPAGTGKTTLAKLISHASHAHFLSINAVSGSIKDIKEALLVAENHPKTLVFIDEIHRFNKKQQDALLPAVESGLITLIGATTENPYFYVNSGLISRCQCYQLHALGADDLQQLIQKSLKKLNKETTLTDELIECMALYANGDARKCLNILEQLIGQFPDEESYTLVQLQSVTNKKDHPRNENDHYDITSALIKSLRGSDADAALYWALRLLEQGESVEFIVRRLIIFASEDIGNADPQALSLTTALLEASRFVGLPEIEINLSHVLCYLALAPKSNRCYAALKKAKQYLKEHPSEAVPKQLRDAHYAGAKKSGIGQGYLYPHDYDLSLVNLSYWSESAEFYCPSQLGYEKKLSERLAYIRKHIKQ